MPAANVAAQVRTSLASLKAGDLQGAQIMEVLKLAHQLTDTMKLFFSSLDQSICQEFNYIAEYISRTRNEIAALRPNDIKTERIPTAGAELEAVVGDTEKATETIMSAAEDVLCDDSEDFEAYRANVEARMMTIIEACSFQDLAGQRVSKVVNSLRHVEDRVARFAEVMGVRDAEFAPQEETAKEKRDREQLLNGPAMGGPETSQDDIDAMFAAMDAPPVNDLDQGSIDSLFD
ncbi:protein phosphatase CheZ [uncultured Maricaulis sp.]|uniref:protein phosphatase CheZ n=1 Tax=uncultured Maricaulis sp. TaxID=174710 RepID=UPI0030DBA164